MMISTKGRYALRFALDLAQNSNGNTVSLKSVASRQSISKKYLEQIVPLLVNANIIVSSRGSSGGYKLARSADSITVAEVLTASDGTLAPVSCLAAEVNTCPKSAECITLPVWQGLQNVVTEYLTSITLQSVVDSYISRSSDEYYI
ncbi:MAG: Rrf2 family transcriptional regulator [Clostridiales bacterium]|nr:Rrf2 family transcriptional regulator [Clostridiales bacterium]